MGCQASRHSAEAEEEQQGVVRACIATDEGGDDEAAGRRTKILWAAGRPGGVHSLNLEDKLELASALAGGPSHADRSSRGSRFQPSASDSHSYIATALHENLPSTGSEGAGGFEVVPERSSYGARAGKGTVGAGGHTWEPAVRRGSTGGTGCGADATVAKQATSRRVRRVSVDEAAALIAITKNFSTRGAFVDPSRPSYAHRAAGSAAAAPGASSGGLAGSPSMHSSSRGSGGYRAAPFFSHGGSEPQSAAALQHGGSSSVRRASAGAPSTSARRFSISGGCEEDGERGPGRGGTAALETSGRRRGRSSSPGQPTVVEQEALDAEPWPDSPTTRGLLELQQRHHMRTQQQMLNKQQQQQHSPGATGRRPLALASPVPASPTPALPEEPLPSPGPAAARGQAQLSGSAIADAAGGDGRSSAGRGGVDEGEEAEVQEAEGEGEEEEGLVLLPERGSCQGSERSSWQSPGLTPPQGQSRRARGASRGPPEPLLLLRGISDEVLPGEGEEGSASAGGRAATAGGAGASGIRLLSAPHVASSLPASPRDKDLSAGVRPRGAAREAEAELEALLSSDGAAGASPVGRGPGPGSTGAGCAKAGAAAELDSPLPGMATRA